GGVHGGIAVGGRVVRRPLGGDGGLLRGLRLRLGVGLLEEVRLLGLCRGRVGLVALPALVVGRLEGVVLVLLAVVLLLLVVAGQVGGRLHWRVLPRRVAGVVAGVVACVVRVLLGASGGRSGRAAPHLALGRVAGALARRQRALARVKVGRLGRRVVEARAGQRAAAALHPVLVHAGHCRARHAQRLCHVRLAAVQVAVVGLCVLVQQLEGAEPLGLGEVRRLAPHGERFPRLVRLGALHLGRRQAGQPGREVVRHRLAVAVVLLLY
ncbi:hypothetical protein DFJ74DRAFT_652602, partial [Hyaloraphidium curvatum]